MGTDDARTPDDQEWLPWKKSGAAPLIPWQPAEDSAASETPDVDAGADAPSTWAEEAMVTLREQFPLADIAEDLAHAAPRPLRRRRPSLPPLCRTLPVDVCPSTAVHGRR